MFHLQKLFILALAIFTSGVSAERHSSGAFIPSPTYCVNGQGFEPNCRCKTGSVGTYPNCRPRNLRKYIVVADKFRSGVYIPSPKYCVHGLGFEPNCRCDSGSMGTYPDCRPQFPVKYFWQTNSIYLYV
jgi:hypothetical protein